MKGFYIEVTNNLLEPKHRKSMRESVWLFMWLLDKITSITEDGIGRVLGGKPIIYKEISEELGISKRTYVDWIANLKKGGYISTIRAPKGLIISVNKAKKKFGQKSGVKCRKPYSEVQNSVQRSAETCTSNIRQFNDNNKDKLFKISKGEQTVDKERRKKILADMKTDLINKKIIK